jgi:hypothetical protein
MNRKAIYLQFRDIVMYQKTFLHHNPSTGVLVAVTVVPTRPSQYANKKECLDFYMNPDNPLTAENNCDKISHDRN